MSSIDDNLKPDSDEGHVPGDVRRRRRARVAAACALAGSALLVSLGISTGQTALSSGSAPVAELRVDPAAADVGSPASTAGGARTGLWLAGLGLRSTHRDRDRILADLLGTRWFDGRPVRAAYALSMRVTAYSPDERSCGDSADGITASGYSVLTNGGFLVAADPRVLPLGALVSVPGYDGGAVVPILDVGGAIKGDRLDVLFPTHEAAMRWGVRQLDVTVWEYADGLPSGFKRLRRPSK